MRFGPKKVLLAAGFNRLSTRIALTSPTAALTFVNLLIEANDGNVGSVTRGDSTMAALADGKPLEVGAGHYFASEVGVMHDAAEIYLWCVSANDSVWVEGVTR